MTPWLQSNVRLRPRHDNGVDAPGLVAELVDRRLGDSNLRLRQIATVFDGNRASPAIVAVGCDVKGHDALVVHGSGSDPTVSRWRRICPALSKESMRREGSPARMRAQGWSRATD